MNQSSNKIKLILIILLVATNIAWSIEHFSQKSELKKVQTELGAVVQNKKILIFQKLFIDKVLKSDGQVDFDTRVMLQNSVNNTGDGEVILAWNNFLKSKTEAEGQVSVKELLSLMSSKVYGD